LLVRDLNGDGTISDGTELFGNNTVMTDGSKAVDGYQALTELDTNHDGVINRSDAVYSQLGVWVDANSDGISEAGEVKSLAALGITEISVIASVTSNIDHGNILGLTSSYRTADGVSHLAGDVWFAVQPAALGSAALPALYSDQVAALSEVNVQSLSLGNPLDGQKPGAESLAQRTGTLAQAIGSFDMSLNPATAPMELNTTAIGNQAASMPAVIAVGNLVDQMRGFTGTNLTNAPTAMATSSAAGLSAMQVGPVGQIDPIKISSINDFNSLAAVSIKKS
jgi:hypothetical protein